MKGLSREKLFKNHWTSGTVMIPNQNLEIFASVTLFILAKFVSAVVLKYRASMYDKNKALTSIPEKNESEDDLVKWVPKKKHEVLKAKYKCLKKLFQIYDASVIGILPESYPETYQESPKSHRRKRSHRTKTDASAGTTELSSGDVSLSATEKSAVASVIRDFKMQQYTSTQVSKTTLVKDSDKYDKSTQESKEDVSTDSINSDKESECVQTSEPHPIPYLMLNERRRPTRLQSFINRLLGIKPERHNFSPGHVYAMSDNNISNRYEKRKRRGLRFRRRRPRKVHSEIAMRDMKSPIILSYVQSVQRSCLMDTTPRQCPILGCKMVFYGIINYNDHLNLCHFLDRKFVCHYCHEGFSNEYDKILHENEHIGISKIAANLPTSLSTARESGKIASNTQTDPEASKCDGNVPEEKLKKIVSFFDKIADPNHVIDQMKKNRYSESNLQSLQQSSESETTDIDEAKSLNTEKRVLSSRTLKTTGRKSMSSSDSDRTSNFPCGHHVTCHVCGENFDFRRQLSLHVDLEHKVHDRFSKFNSCPGIINRPPQKTAEISSEDGRINVQSLGPISSKSTYSDVSRTKSVEALNCDPSANIVYFTSVESVVKKPSVVGSLVHKIRSYKWEPGTKIVRV